MRAILVVAAISVPSLLVPDVMADTNQMVALIAIFAGLLVFIEYNATYPGLVEFRDAPPFNRLRFGMFLAIVLGLAVVERGHAAPSSLTGLVEALAYLLGQSLDFPYSPVRLASLMMDAASPAQEVAVRSAAGLAYALSLVVLAIFALSLRSGAWPTKGLAFNVWVNLPTFDPTAGGDVVDRLDRDARINLVLGILLPFLVPAVIKLTSPGLDPVSLTSSLTLIWTMTAWAFLPASLIMRGMAMARVAEMIRQKRRANGAQATGTLATA